MNEKLVQMNVRVPEPIKRAYKAAAAATGENIERLGLDAFLVYANDSTPDIEARREKVVAIMASIGNRERPVKPSKTKKAPRMEDVGGQLLLMNNPQPYVASSKVSNGSQFTELSGISQRVDTDVDVVSFVPVPTIPQFQLPLAA